MSNRRTVRCWVCGRKARRVPNACGLYHRVTPTGRLRVVGRKRTVVPFGKCSRGVEWEDCDGVMLLPKDLRYLLRAAIQHDRQGGNRMSEYD